MNPIDLANQAYDKDFRWWFLALLVCVLIGGIWALKYLLSRSETEQTAHKEHISALMVELSSSRQNHHDKMDAMQARAFEMTREAIAVITETKKVVESNTRESEKVRTVIERLERDHK